VAAVRYVPGKDRISTPPLGAKAKKSPTTKGQGEN
jgi:hypothetical protein